DEDLVKLRLGINRLPNEIHHVILVSHFPLNRRQTDSFLPPRIRSLAGLLDSQWSAFTFLAGSWRNARLAVDTLADGCRERGCKPYLLDGHRHERNFGTAGSVVVAEAESLRTPYSFLAFYRTPSSELRSEWFQFDLRH